MCFHYSMSQVAKNLENRYKATIHQTQMFSPVHHANGFNHPALPVITMQAPETIQLYNWGLIPQWIRDDHSADEIRTKTLNARSETIYEKPSFKNAIITQRCLIPADGFYEWQQFKNQKYPYFIHLKMPTIFSFAGIWEKWESELNNNHVRYTFSIITTPANSLMEKIHNTKKRMPLILPPQMEKKWLDPTLSKSAINDLLIPYTEKNMEAYTISKMVSAKNGYSNTSEIKQKFIYPELMPGNNLFSET